MARKRVAIVQSSYIPWKGYFDLIRAVDEFVLFDDVQFTKRDWRNRNRIKTPEGLSWLTIPVAVKGRFTQRIRDAAIVEPQWAEKHWRTIKRAYGRAPFFREYEPALERLYATAVDDRLSAINHHMIAGVCRLLDIHTPLTWSTDYTLDDDKTGRLVGICRQAGAAEYVSGPSAREYIDTAQFDAAGITLTFADYGGYTEYPQLYPPFEHGVTVIDLLVHAGPEARRFMSDVAPRVAK
jgi:hypothetical protein